MTGEYSWVDPEGTLHLVRYRADHTGYHIVDTVNQPNFVKIVEKPLSFERRKVEKPLSVEKRKLIKKVKVSEDASSPPAVVGLATGPVRRRVRVLRRPTPAPVAESRVETAAPSEPPRIPAPVADYPETTLEPELNLEPVTEETTSTVPEPEQTTHAAPRPFLHVPGPRPLLNLIPVQKPLLNLAPAPKPFINLSAAPQPFINVSPVPQQFTNVAPAPQQFTNLASGDLNLDELSAPLPLTGAPAPTFNIVSAPIPAPLQILRSIPGPSPVRFIPSPVRQPVPAAPSSLQPSVFTNPAAANSLSSGSERTKELFGNSGVTVVKFSSPTHKYEYY